MNSLLLTCWNLFGWRGLIVYAALRMKRTQPLQVPGLRSGLFLRGTQSDENSFREVFLLKAYDLPLPSHWQPQYILDAGANIGLTSIWWAHRYPSARIVCLEPESENFAALQKNVAPYPTIRPYHAALWFESSVVTLVDPGLGSRAFQIHPAAETQAGVAAYSVPDLMAQLRWPSIDILKLDIEGSEKEIFEREEGQWLSKVQCLVVELHDRFTPGCSQALFAALARHNFALTVRGDNLIFIRPDL